MYPQNFCRFQNVFAFYPNDGLRETIQYKTRGNAKRSTSGARRSRISSDTMRQQRLDPHAFEHLLEADHRRW